MYSMYKYNYCIAWMSKKKKYSRVINVQHLTITIGTQ